MSFMAGFWMMCCGDSSEKMPTDTEALRRWAKGLKQFVASYKTGQLAGDIGVFTGRGVPDTTFKG